MNPCHQQVTHKCTYLLTYCTVLLEFSTREGEPLSSTSHAQVYLLKHCSKVYGRRQGYRYFGRAILLASTRVHVDVVSHTYTNTTYFSDTHMHTNTHTQGRQVIHIMIHIHIHTHRVARSSRPFHTCSTHTHTHTHTQGRQVQQTLSYL